MTPEELLKKVGEPVGLFDVYNGDSYIQIKPEYSDETTVKLYTFDQVAAAILKATKPLEDQLAKAEQRVAEACIALIEDRLGELDGQDSEWAAGQVGAIGEIADGGWRKFVKEA